MTQSKQNVYAVTREHEFWMRRESAAMVGAEELLAASQRLASIKAMSRLLWPNRCGCISRKRTTTNNQQHIRIIWLENQTEERRFKKVTHGKARKFLLYMFAFRETWCKSEFRATDQLTLINSFLFFLSLSLSFLFSFSINLATRRSGASWTSYLSTQT